jgi:hypothetical protein
MRKHLPETSSIVFIICLLLLPLSNAAGQTTGNQIANRTSPASDSLSIELAKRIKLYPVPVKTELTVENISGVTLIEIFDVTGNKYRTEVCDHQDQITIPVAELRRGIYFIKFITPRATLLKRFIKE